MSMILEFGCKRSHVIYIRLTLIHKVILQPISEHLEEFRDGFAGLDARSLAVAFPVSLQLL